MTDITANVIVSMPSQLFTMARSFKAVANGKIYIGKIDTDPVNPENQIQVYVENEDGSHVPVSQPIIINAAGYPVYNGQIAKFVTVQGHSMAVYDAYGAQQFYFPNVLKYDPDQLKILLSGDDGASFVAWKGLGSMMLKKTLSDRFKSASVVDFATEYLTMDEIDNIKIDYATGEQNKIPTVDITSRLKQAIIDLGGSHDITSAYLYEPAKVLQLPAGAMALSLSGSDRILIEKNNIIIQGCGAFNTRLVNVGNVKANEMFRFKEAYACGLQHLTLDGGLPNWPVGDESYGVDIPLVLDQVSHFYSEDLNVCNYRHRGYQFIHVWESYFGNLRAHTGGWFRVPNSAPGGLFFDDFRKESTFFPGSESNQVYIAKYSASVNGRVLDFTSPCFNVHIGLGVFENFTFRSFVPEGADVSKVYISGLSSGVLMDHAWHYYHDMPSTVPQTVVFEIFNPGPGCKFDNQVFFQQIDGESGNRLTTPWLINADNTYPMEINMSIDDRNCSSSLFKNRRGPSQIIGDIKYYSDQQRTINDLLGTESANGFVGTISFKAATSWPSTPPVLYNFKGNYNVGLSPIGGGFVPYPEAKTATRMAITFNGTGGGGALLAEGCTLAKQSTGQYKIVFDNSLPSSAYHVSLSIKKAFLNDSIEIASALEGELNVAIRDNLGEFHDSERISVIIMM
ncbi:phage head-binding domain-containing protein [Escherichia coli]|uniref:phage head-binding domain-containing protein n=1 Tax=Escherichia coli TaxID=562 RepID=UPI00202920A9|nr:phage head-binding domain-containing protein [Escherichia coli]